MAKKQQYRPRQQEADAVIAQPKRPGLQGVRWATKPPPGRSPAWLQLQMPVLNEQGMPIQNLRIVITWRPAEHQHEDGYGDAAKMNFVLLYRGVRIRALDTYPLDRHTNRTLLDEPGFEKSILGPHVHRYREAVPDEEPAWPVESPANPDDIQAFWRYFCSECNLGQPDELPLPDAAEGGQMSFPL